MSIRCYYHSVNPEKSRSYIHVSKSTRDKFVARGTHHMIRQGIQEYSPAEKTVRMQEARREAEELQRIADRAEVLKRPWMPAEVGGCHFVLGKADTSQVAHLVRLREFNRA